MAEDRDQRSGGRQLFCRVITPQEVIYDGEADLVIARIADGDIGVLVDHFPLVSTVEAGEVRIRENDEQRVYATSDGFFKVSENLVQVLVEEAVSPSISTSMRRRTASRRQRESSLRSRKRPRIVIGCSRR